MRKIKTFKGIDISYHQGTIDFQKVKNSGIEFVIIREGYRSTTDVNFFKYVEDAKKVDLIILGIYHFSYALNAEEARQEADIAVQNAKKAGLNLDDIYIFFDFEYDTVKKAAAKGVNITMKECKLHTETFCKEIEVLGGRPGIYTNLDYYKNWYQKCELLEKYPVWLADYKGDPDFDCMIQQYSNEGKVEGIQNNVDLNYYFYSEPAVNEDEKTLVRSREAVVSLAKSWVGLNEADGSYKKIIDIYNQKQIRFPRGVKMQYRWSWCACFWSAIAIELGYTDIIPIEISCGYLIDEAKKMGCWEERDDYIPKPGDGILYDWDDNGVGDNTGWPDHVGVIVSVDEKTGVIEVIEGNKSDKVDHRYMKINGKYIRGYIVPEYTSTPIENIPEEKLTLEEVTLQVIQGIWGTGDERKRRLKEAGYCYRDIQDLVNKSLKQNLVIAKEVKEGKWGNGSERKRRLECAGYDYNAIQDIINHPERY